MSRRQWKGHNDRGIKVTNYASVVKGCLLFLVVVLSGCSLSEESTRKNPPVGFIVTPPTSYTTQKGRYLGERYQRNLERLVQQLVQNPVTRNLQFANNLMSVGGIGFFTHSATRSPDERYLEVILGLPDLLDEKADFSSKVSRLFSDYGSEVLSILAGDSEINNDKEVAGFGLNFSWRGTSEGPSGQRVVLERMVVYLSKVESQRFLARQMNQEQLLVGSVIFVLQSEGPPTLLRYVSRTSKPEVQPPILKETAEKMPEVPKLEPKVREIELQDSPPEKKKEERIPPPPAPVAKAPKREDLKVETEKGPSSKAKKSVAAATKEAVKDTGERIGEVPRAEVKPVPLSPQTKAPKREAPSQKEIEDRISEKTTPAFPAQKTIKDEGAETPTVGVKTPPAPPVVAETSKRQETPSKKVTEAAATIAGKEIPVLPSAKEPKREKPAEKKVEQLALKKAPTVPQLEKPKPQVLRGYIVQLSFADRAEAERWFSLLNQEGYVASINLSGEGRPVRLRVGNFPSSGEAKNALGRFQKKGLTGLVVQLPN